MCSSRARRLGFSMIVLISEPLGYYAEGCFSCHDRVYFYKVPLR